MLKKSIALLAAAAAVVSCTAFSALASGRPVRQPEATIAPTQAPTEIQDPNVPLANAKTVNVMELTIGSKNVGINGEDKVHDVAPIIVNDRTMVPLRAIAEGLLADVTWDGEARKVTIKLGEDTIVVTIDSAVMTVNGSPVTLDSAAFISNDRTFVPIRAISEAFDAEVEWDEAAQKVTVTTELAVDSKGEPTVITPTADPSASPEASPEATADPSASPEATVDPSASPEASPEATVDPSASPESSPKADK